MWQVTRRSLQNKSMVRTYIVDMKIISTWISNYVNITVAEWAERNGREVGTVSLWDKEQDGKSIEWICGGEMVQILLGTWVKTDYTRTDLFD